MYAKTHTYHNGAEEVTTIAASESPMEGAVNFPDVTDANNLTLDAGAIRKKTQPEKDAEAQAVIDAKEAAALAQFDTPVNKTYTEVIFNLLNELPQKPASLPVSADKLTEMLQGHHKAKGRA